MEKRCNLFTEWPYMEDEMIAIHQMSDLDAEALLKMCNETEVYRYVPMFLFEQKYENKHEVIAKIQEECFDTT